MNILFFLIGVSTALVAAGLALFVWTVRQRTFEHADRLVHLPFIDTDDEDKS